VRFTSLFGLPAHVFFVHIPIILIPLVTVGTALMFWPSMRRRFGWTLVVLAGTALVATVLATESGKSLKRYVPSASLVRQHTRLGGNLTIWAALLFLLVVAIVVWDRWTQQQASGLSADELAANTAKHAGSHPMSTVIVQRIGLGLSALAVVVAGVSSYWVYRIGHSGAKASWTIVQKRIDAGQQVGREGGR
jgi:hypothetical protein